MGKKVTIYSRTTCAYCPMVKKYLDMKHVAYDVINLDEQPEMEDVVIAKSGARTVPVTFIKDESAERESIVIGWNPGKLAEALAA